MCCLVNSIDSIFIYNRTFAEGTVQTAHAWKELFPPENGFFSHPEIAPKRSTLAVYHVLHCLVSPLSLKLHLLSSNYHVNRMESAKRIGKPISLQ